MKLNENQVQVIKNKELSFYQRDPETIKNFIVEHVFKLNPYIYENWNKKIPTLEAFLFAQSSCQRQHSDEWGRLFSFLINMPPVPIEESQRRANEAKERMAAIAIKMGIMQKGGNVLDADVLKRLQALFKTQEGQRYQLF